MCDMGKYCAKTTEHCLRFPPPALIPKCFKDTIESPHAGCEAVSECMNLLSCPFCGANAKMTDNTFGDSMTEYYRAECDNGHALDCWDDTEIEATETWNKRAI